MVQIEMYFLRAWRVWVIRVIDENGEQVGQVQTSRNRTGALQLADKLMEAVEQ